MENSMTPISSVKKPWYRRWWFIILVILLGLWVASPWWFKIFGLGSDDSAGFTELPGAVGSTSDVFDVVTTDDPTIGFAAAPVTIVEFGDFECPFCKQAAPILKQLLAKYPDTIKIIYRDFPVSSIHPNALPAAVAANCANRQGKFWEFHDQLYAGQDNLGVSFYNSLAQRLKLNTALFSSCLNSADVAAEIKQDFEAGLAAGVRGTPTFFVNGRKVEGALPYDVWVKIIVEMVTQKFRNNP